MMLRRWPLFIALLSFVAAVAFCLNLLFGSVNLLSLDRDSALMLLVELRLPRAILSALVGASLAVAGAAFQGIFRNPLADPFVIGASSGAALGAGLAIVLALPGLPFLSSSSLSAFVGALFATVAAFVVSRSAGNPPPSAALLLAGTALSALFSALLTLILVVKDQDLHRVYYWLLGGLGGSTWQDLIVNLPLMLLGMALVCIAARPLDLLSFGEESAESLGLNVSRARLIVAGGASLATAASVSAAGTIGFVGLIAPHLARLIAGPSFRRLVVTSALFGAILVLLSDLIARLLFSPMELPIGVVTSCLGSPFFIFLLVKRGHALGMRG